MKKLKTFIVESVSPDDFYNRHWEGHVVEEIVRLLDGKASYKLVLNEGLLRRAIRNASESVCDIFHLSCHGDEKGICLSDKRDISWEALADSFQTADHMPTALVLSSCAGGDGAIARVFAERERRPQVIFGAEGTGKHVLTFPGACISWPILYTALATHGMNRKAFMDAVDKMNLITSHQFVYRRWDEKRYRRHPSRR